MRILDTGIELTILPYAVKGYQYIEMSVVPFGTLDEPISTFSSNSSVIVELLPNRATFSTPVRLSLPHCLKLKKGFSKRSVKVYLSHHEKGWYHCRFNCSCLIWNIFIIRTFYYRPNAL